MPIRMSIWQWQDVFQNAVEQLFDDILQILELPIVSKTFTVGIPFADRDVARIVFHPEDCGYTPEEFQQVFSLTKNNFDRDPEQLFFRGNADLNRVHKDSLYPKALQKAVSSILNCCDRQQDWISFCSFPIQKNQYWIITVVQLKRPDFDRQYRLSKQTHEVHSRGQQRIERCFLEALIYRVLQESELELQRPSEGNTLSLGNSERVIEDAASSLLKSIELHINQWNRIDLVSFANAIAAERYEGAASQGRLILCQTNHPDICTKVKLRTPVKIYNYRGIRKLLEVSSTEMALLCNCESVWGLGNSLDTYQPSRENLFEIRFAEHHTWELFHARNIMLRVKYRQPRLPRARFDRQLFYDHIHELFQVNEHRANLLIDR